MTVTPSMLQPLFLSAQALAQAMLPPLSALVPAGALGTPTMTRDPPWATTAGVSFTRTSVTLPAFQLPQGAGPTPPFPSGFLGDNVIPMAAGPRPPDFVEVLWTLASDPTQPRPPGVLAMVFAPWGYWSGTWQPFNTTSLGPITENVRGRFAFNADVTGDAGWSVGGNVLEALCLVAFAPPTGPGLPPGRVATCAAQALWMPPTRV